MDKTTWQCANALYGNGAPPTEIEVNETLRQREEMRCANESEHRHQARLHIWLKKNDILHFAPANEGKRSEEETRRLTAIGFTCGVLDMWVMEARKPYHGLIIELKTKDGVVSGSQEYWLKSLNRRFYKAVVSYSFEESKKVVIDYFSLPRWEQ